jgi:hypothetical protein
VGVGDQHRGHIAGLQVGQQGVQGVGDGGVDEVAGLVAGAEHEVVDQQMAAVVEQLGQGRWAVVGVEAVGLVDRDPGQLAALAGQLVADPGVDLLALQQLLAGGLPLLRADNLVLGHHGWPPRWRAFLRRSVLATCTEPMSVSSL